jgi:peptidyl-tRNA hydrolase
MYSSKSQCIYVEKEISNNPVVLAIPQTFMNLSGRAVRGLSDYLNVNIKYIAINLYNIFQNL